MILIWHKHLTTAHGTSWVPAHFVLCPTCKLAIPDHVLSYENRCHHCLVEYVNSRSMFPDNDGMHSYHYRCPSCGGYRDDGVQFISCKSCSRRYPHIAPYIYCPFCGFSERSRNAVGTDISQELLSLENSQQFHSIQRLAISVLTQPHQEFAPDKNAMLLKERLPELVRRKLNLCHEFSMHSIIRDQFVHQHHWNSWQTCGLFESLMYAMMLHTSRVTLPEPFGSLYTLLGGMALEQTYSLQYDYQLFVQANPQYSAEAQRERQNAEREAKRKQEEEDAQRQQRENEEQAFLASRRRYEERAMSILSGRIAELKAQIQSIEQNITDRDLREEQIAHLRVELREAEDKFLTLLEKHQ